MHSVRKPVRHDPAIRHSRADLRLDFAPVELVEANGIDAPPDVLEAAELNPWAVEFRYEADSEPALDRHATLKLIEGIRRWAGEQIQAMA
jgi:hypothetical protein